MSVSVDLAKQPRQGSLHGTTLSALPPVPAREKTPLPPPPPARLRRTDTAHLALDKCKELST